MARNIKVKQIKKFMTNGEDDQNTMNGMFSQMMGMEDGEIEIILPKFVQGRNIVRRIYRLLHQFATFTAIQNDFPYTKESMNEILKFIDDMKESIVFNELTKNKDETKEMYQNLDKKTINEFYRKFKENGYIKKLIVLCGYLKQFSSCFIDKNNLKDNFIGQEPGLTFYIFDFSSLDLKKLWADKNLKPMVKKYILNVLNLLYTELYNLYKIITSPDIDIDQFSRVLLDSIQKLKKQPGLNRCDNAFKRIEDSVELLKGNFDNYYRESIASSNPNMIVENFIIDVSNQGGANPRLTREFRQIIQYMHKVSANTGKNKDPNVKKLFDMLNKNFEVMEKTNKSEKNTEQSLYKNVINHEFYSSGQLCYDSNNDPVEENKDNMYQEFKGTEEQINNGQVPLLNAHKYTLFVNSVLEQQISNLEESINEMNDDETSFNFSKCKSALAYVNHAMNMLQKEIDNYVIKMYDPNFSKDIVINSQDLIDQTNDLIKNAKNIIQRGYASLPGIENPINTEFIPRLFLPGEMYKKPEKQNTFIDSSDIYVCQPNKQNKKRKKKQNK